MPAIPVVIERFYPQTVSSKPKFLQSHVAEREGKHAVQVLQTFYALILIEVNDGFSICKAF